LLDTDKQRRWWFATHPDQKGGRSRHKGKGPGGNNDNPDKIVPEKVDAWADDRLKYEKDPIGTELLKQAKFWFGTEFASKSPGEKYALLWGDDKPVASDILFAGKFKIDPSARDPKTHERNRQFMLKYIREEMAPPLDPTRVLDIIPGGRELKLIPAAKQLLKNFLKSSLRRAIVNAVKKGGEKGPRLPPKGSLERKTIEAARNRGIRAKQKEELENIRAGGKGSGVWTEKELEGIRQSSQFPDDAVWHHDPTVANVPGRAADPSGVRPVRGGRKGHLNAHGGNWKLPLPKDEN
jgi:hypothetical protein